MLKSKLIVKSNKMVELCNRSNWSHGFVLQSGESEKCNISVFTNVLLAKKVYCDQNCRLSSSLAR